MIYVFSEWYLTRDYIKREFLDKIPGILQNKYNFKNEYETLKNVSFVSVRNVGRSQKILIAELKRLSMNSMVWIFYVILIHLWPSFGFGVLFATEFNVPNNAPLVIWAETSNWYPLLPRRVNNKNDIVDLTDMYD